MSLVQPISAPLPGRGRTLPPERMRPPNMPQQSLLLTPSEEWNKAGVWPARRGSDSLGIADSIRRKLREVKDASAQIARSRSFKRRSSSAPRAPVVSNDTDGPSLFGTVGRAWTEGVPRQHRSSSEVLPQFPGPSVGEGEESSGVNVSVPQLLQHGVPMLKVSAKKQKRYVFRLDPDQGQIVWQSKKLRIIPIENIKELREGADARYYREQFQLAQDFEDRWLTVVYVLDGGYKTLHLIAATRDVFQMWDITLRRLYALRQKLMTGLGNTEVRHAVWEKQFWRSAVSDAGADQRLDFDQVERLCRRLNINPSREDLFRRFRQADTQSRGYLDFSDFQRFVQALKARPEVGDLYRRLTAGTAGVLTYSAFQRFMLLSQKSTLSDNEMQRIFKRYASVRVNSAPGGSSPPQNTLELAVQSISAMEQIVPTFNKSGLPVCPLSSSTATNHTSSSSAQSVSVENAVMSLKGFTTFLLSADNSAFADQHGKVYHDMTRPLPDYYISSSHNTYLVGHQLVGESTIEGYIRALLHSCRSVELDIYDGDTEPVIYHGHTLTSKVSLRDTCVAIHKYAFVASPYPIIISAEIHCSVPQQEMIASIMREEFGDTLVSAPVNGRPKIEVLPSPEDLKGRILLKTKNLYVSDQDRIRERDISVGTESSSTETSASDVDVPEEVLHERRKVRENEAEAIRDLKSEFRKARTALRRVRSPRSDTAFMLPPSPRADARDLPPTPQLPQKVKMSLALIALLVYTVGVKCRGLNKKEVYAPEHMFSLSEKTANRILKEDMVDLIKHNRNHLVRVYPKGMRIGSTNFEPHRYWSAGAQLVAINWQTFDLGYMLNHAMFQRNGRAGYVLKPLALRITDKQLLSKRTSHIFEVTIISAQQLPRPKDSSGRDVSDRSTLNPHVEVSLHIPDWPQATSHASTGFSPDPPHWHPSAAPPGGLQIAGTAAQTVSARTAVVKNNGFNPVWGQQLSLRFDLVGEMRDLVFVRFAVTQDGASDEEPLAVYCASLGSLNMGYRHLPLHDAQLSQYLFSTLFVKLDVRDM